MTSHDGRLFLAAPVLLGIALSVSAQPAAPTGPVKVDSETISGLGARNIGSATMSGRVAAIDAVHEGSRLTVYIGAASGGVWKSVNGGTTYKPVFDKQPVQSIGAITIDPKNPKTLWVGTGESWTRNSVSIGDGIYKSVDGGDNWTNVGLGATERIVKILVDPTQTDTVYACAPGKLWSDSDDRGVYKTTDGGRTWTKILKGGNRLDRLLHDLDGSPEPPDDLRRDVGLPPQGLDLSLGRRELRGGERERVPQDRPTAARRGPISTRRARRDFPRSRGGASPSTVAPSKPNVVYAFIEAVVPKNGLYRSEDGGATWQAVDRSQNMVWRPFYFANLIVDPKDENKLYKPDLSLIVSTDGGKTFTNVGGGAHGDFHDVWIDPADTDHLIAGDDGGLWYSLRRRRQLVEGGQPADLPVLPRERGHGPAVQRVRRPAGQQLLGRRLRLSRRHRERAVGEHVRRRRLLDVRRPGRSDVHLRRGAGRHDRPRQSQDARDARHPAAARATRRASSASTGTRRST